MSGRASMRVLLLAIGTTALTTLVVSNAYYKKEQFYPTVVYLLNSNRSLSVLYLQGFVMLYLFCNLLKKIFFGSLREAEVEHLIESSWFAVLETFILLAAFHQELNISFVGMVSVLFVMKSFHWLAGDRIDYMERSPLISWLFHIRAVTLLLLLGTLDYLFIRSAWHSVSTRGLTVEIVFGLEYAIMFLNMINTLLRYILHTIDLQSEDPWENKTIYMRVVDIVLGFFKLMIYMSYMSFMLYVLFIPLHIARRIYITAKNFQKSIADVVSSHRAIRNLNTLYPDATPEELDTANNVCIICREEMVSRCKKLPCNHIFHMACLRSWFQRQQTCPTCRMDVLSESVLSRLNQAQTRRQQQQQQQNNNQQAEGQAQQDGQGALPPHMVFPMMWPGMVPPQMQQRQAQQQNQPTDQPNQQQPPTGDEPDSAGSAQAPPTVQEGGGATQNGESQPQTAPQSNEGATNWGQGPNMPPFPPFMMPPPFMGPPFGAVPPFGGMPSGEVLQGLTDEQLHSLEGMERANVEARIELLRNIQRLLDSAVTQLNQYSAVMATLGTPAGPGFPGYPSPPETVGASNSTGPTLYTAQTSQAQASDQTSTPPKPAFESQTSFTGSTSKLSELKPMFSFSATALDDEAEASGNESFDTDPSEVVKSKPSSQESKLEPVAETDDPSQQHMADIRHRRLQRFNSMPQAGSVVDTERGQKSSKESSGEKED